MQITYRSIWQITYPILLSLFVEQLIGITDTAFLGHLGEIELGASALAGTCYLIVYVIGSGFGIGLQILIARLNGEKNREEIQEVLYSGIFFLLLLALIIIALSKIGSSFILEHFIQSEAICQQVISYLNWRIYGLFFSFLIIAFRAYFVGTTQTKILTISSVMMVLTNILCNYILIFGKCGVPAMGISGAALGSTIAEGASALLLIIHSKTYTWSKINIRWRYLKRILNLSVWTMSQSLLSFVSWFIFFITIEHLGEQALAVSNIIRSISAIPFVFVIAFASAASSLVSNLLGEFHTNMITTLIKKITTLCYISCFSILFICFAMPSLLLQIYTENVFLINIAIAPLYVMLSSYLITIPAFILFYTVSGTGNTLSSLVIGILSLIGYILFIELINHYTKSLLWIWFSEHIYAFCLLVFSVFYLRFFNWKEKKI